MAAGTFDSMAASGSVARPQRSREKCPKCHDTGWVISWWLHTQEGQGYAHVKKERITEAQYKDLWGKIDHTKQKLYEAAKRCACPVPQDWASQAEAREA